MATATRRFSNRTASLLHLNWLVKVSCGERIGVPEAVIRLDIIFPEKVVRRVTIITSGDRPMARLDPRIVVFSHDVAVGAGRRVIGQIRPALGIKKSVAADTEPETQNDSENDGRNLLGCCWFHSSKSLNSHAVLILETFFHDLRVPSHHPTENSWASSCGRPPSGGIGHEAGQITYRFITNSRLTGHRSGLLCGIRLFILFISNASCYRNTFCCRGKR